MRDLDVDGGGTRNRRGGSALVLALLCAGFFPLRGEASARAAEVDAEAWTEVQGAHLRVVSDAGAAATTEVAERLEAFLGAFATLAPALETTPPAPTVVVAFRDLQTFDRYRAGPAPRSGRILGQFLPGADGAFLTLSVADEGLPAVEILQHELVHHLVEANFPGAPRWLHEGLAEVYGTFELVDGHARIGRAPERHRRFLETRPWSVGDIAVVERGDHDGAGPEFYAVSWLLLHRLLARPDRMAGLADLLLAFEVDDDPVIRLEDALGVSIDELDAELRADLAAGRATGREVALGSGVRGVSPARRVSPARALVTLARLSLRTGRASRAEAELQRALDHDPRSPEAHAGLAHLRELDGRLEEAGLLYDDAVTLGPGDSWTWLLRGRFGLQHRPEDRASAREDLERAVAMEPGWIEARRLLALGHLAPGGDPAEGLRVLAPARATSPGRIDLAESEVRLRIADEDWAGARHLIAGEMEGRVDWAVVAALEDLVSQREHLAAARVAQGAGDYEEAARRVDAAIEVTSDSAETERLEEALRVLQTAAEEKERAGVR